LLLLEPANGCRLNAARFAPWVPTSEAGSVPPPARLNQQTGRGLKSALNQWIKAVNRDLTFDR